MKNHPALVFPSLIDQAAAYTAPRGRCEMGGLLLGHIDEDGNNVAVCGFFPKQTKENSGYCEFDGSYNALAAAACDYANEEIKDDSIPELRIIGWIHTHPDIGIFLSGIDVRTFAELRDQCRGRRFMAVVVDPLRQDHGVFNDEKKPSKHEYAKCDGELAPKLTERYNVLLDRLRFIQTQRGMDVLPCIISGPLHSARVAAGDRDDIRAEMDRGFFMLKAEVSKLSEMSEKHLKEIKHITQLNISMEKQIAELESNKNELIERMGKMDEEIKDTSKIKNGLRQIWLGIEKIVR